ncbi:MAG: hypothetical protein ACI96M_001197 [Candidatus Azotimanducaceae bacterium]
MATKISDFVQTVTGLAVLIGLALVVWELQQTKELVSVQLLSSSYDSLIEQRRSIAGENSGESLYRVMTSSPSVSEYDYFVVDLLYESFTNQISRLVDLEKRGLYSRLDGAASTRAYYFTCPYGRAWLDNAIEFGFKGVDGDDPLREAFISLRAYANDGDGKGSAAQFHRQVMERMTK